MFEVHTWLIKGLSPLMQSNPEAFIIGDDDSGALKTKKVYEDTEEAALRVYKRRGRFCHPASSFRRAMSNAVSGRKFGKKSARMVVVGAVFPCEEWCEILDAKGRVAKEYEIDVRPAVVGSGKNKSRIRRARPKFTEWSMKLALEVDMDLIDLDQVTQALNLAGKTIGIGEFRPDPSDSKSGIGHFGRFEASLVQ